MQLKVPQFRHFIKDLTVNSGRPSWLEMAMNAEINDDIPLSPQLAVLLSFIPDGESAQAAALHWISTEGLYKASKGREVLAKIATQKMGRTVHEDEIFSTQAHKLSKDSGENPNLEDLWNSELKSLYEEEYEPKSIPVGRREIPLADLNRALAQHGFKPFSFGGTDGYMEWLEASGGYSNKYITDPHITDGPGGGAAHVRHGVDLSKPEKVEYEDKPGHYYIRYGAYNPNTPRFVPQNNASHYQRRLATMLAASRPEIDKIRRGETSPHLSNWGEEGDAMAKWLQSAQVGQVTQSGASPAEKKGSKAKATGFVAGSGIDIPKPEDPALLAKFREVIAAGLEAQNNDNASKNPENRWSPEQIQALLAHIMDSKPDVMRFRYTDPIKKTKPNTSALVNKGLAALGKDGSYLQGGEDGGQTLDYFYGVQGVDHKSFTKVPQYSKTPVDIETLKSQGFTPTSGEESWPARLASGSVTLRHGDYDKSRKSYKIERGDDGKWYMLEPTGSHEDTDKGYKPSPSSIVMPGYAERDPSSGQVKKVVGGVQDAGKKIEIPADSKKSAAIESDWEANPEAYGDNILRSGVQESIAKAASAGFFKALRVWNGTVDGKEAKTKLGGDEGLWGYAYEAMRNIMGSYMFKFGDPSKEFEKEVEDESKDTSINGLLASIAGLTAPELQKWCVDTFYYVVNQENRDPTPQDFAEGDIDGEKVYEAFLKNGFYWRVNEAAKRVSSMVIRHIQEDMKMKSGVGSKGEDGEASDLIGGNTGRDVIDKRLALQGDDVAPRKVSRYGDAKVVRDTGDLIRDKQHVVSAKRDPIKGTREMDYTLPPSYSTSHTSAKLSVSEKLHAFLRNHADVAHADHLERDQARKKNFAPIAELVKLVKSAAGKEDADGGIRMGTVDGIADGISNFIYDRMQEVQGQTPSPDWISKMEALYHAFFLDGGKYDIAKVAKDEANVDITMQWAEIKSILEKEGMADLHSKISTGAKTRQQRELDDKAAIDAEAEAERQQRLKPATPTATPGAPGIPTAPAAQPQYTGYASYGGRDDDEEDEIPIRRGVPGKPQPTQVRQATQQPPNYDRKAEGRMISFNDYRNQKLAEYTGVVMGSNPKLKLPDGCGFNVWGAPGRAGGVSIGGEVPVKKDKKKGKK